MSQQAEREAKYIAGRFGEFVASTKFDRDPVFGKWSKEERDAVREIVTSHPMVSPEELKSIERINDVSFKSQVEGARIAPYMIVPVARARRPRRHRRHAHRLTLRISRNAPKRGKPLSQNTRRGFGIAGVKTSVAAARQNGRPHMRGCAGVSFYFF